MKTLVNNNQYITLCGSTKHKKQFKQVETWLTLKFGCSVYSCAIFGHADNIKLTDEQKHQLDLVHKRKIDNSEAIFVINADGYIGDSTKAEIKHAESKSYCDVFYFSDFELEILMWIKQNGFEHLLNI